MSLDSKFNSALLHYARYHGLARPHQQSDVNIQDDLPLPRDIGITLFDSSAVLIPDLAPDLSLLREKISLDEDARLLLASIIKPVDDLSPCREIKRYDVQPTRKFKLQLPLLLTDDEFDHKSFCCRRNQSPWLGPANLELIPGLDEDEGGFSWSSKSLELPSYYENQLNAEKFTVDRNAMLWLQSTLKSDVIDADLIEKASQEPEIRRKSVLRPLTPPLSPVPENLGVAEPFSITEELAPLADSTSPTIHISMALDDSLMRQDALCFHTYDSVVNSFQTNTADLANPYSPFETDSNMFVHSSPNFLRAADLKLEEMLIPAYNIQVSKSVSGSDDLSKFANSLSNPEDDKGPDSEDDFDAIFNELIEVGACQANDELENEQLRENDSMRRLKVLDLDFSIPPPPWTASMDVEKQEEEIRELMLPIAKIKLHHLPVPKNERELRWVPFSLNLGKQAVEEEIDGDKLVQRFVDLTGLGDDIDPRALSWKPEGLRILDDRCEDEKLDTDTFDSTSDLEVLLRKRKIEFDSNGLDNDTEKFTSRPPSEEMEPSSKLKTMARGTRNWENRAVVLSGLSPNESPLLFNDVFSASEELGKFLEMRTGRASKMQKTSNGPCATPTVHKDVLIDLTEKKTQKPVPEITDSVTKQAVQEPMLNATPWPKVHLCGKIIPAPESSTRVSQEPRPIIVSSTVLSQQRQLIKAILSLDSSLQLISRDFSASYSKLETAIEREADVIISPNAGIILTTLQKIKQKPLPGQGDFSALRTRLLKICPCYEHLYVLVCASSVSAQLPISLPAAALSSLQDQAEIQIKYDAIPQALLTQDIESLASLTSFAATLSSLTDITISFLPSATANLQAIARWILGLVHANELPSLSQTHRPAARSSPKYDCDGQTTRNAAQHSDWAFLQEETTWELLLRRAGMNAFAAQGLLLALKEPVDAVADCDGSVAGDGERERDKTVHGLSAFVLMTPLERQSRFAGLLGGARVLDRVGRVFDRGWGGKA